MRLPIFAFFCFILGTLGCFSGSQPQGYVDEAPPPPVQGSTTTPTSPPKIDSILESPGSIYPTTWRVAQDGSGDFGSLAPALGAARTGDKILIAPGIYIESLEITGKALSLIGEGGPGRTILDGNGAEFTLKIVGVNEPGAYLEGLTITGAGGSRGEGLVLESSVLIANDVRIEDNIRGVYLLNTQAQFLHSEISNNSANAGGSAILATGFSQTTLSNTLIAGNKGTIGGAIHVNGGMMTLRHCSIVANGGTHRGGSIYVQSHPIVDAQLYLYNTILAHTTQGAAIYVHDPSVTFEALGSVFWDNEGGNLAGSPVLLLEELGNRFVDPKFVGVWPRGDFSAPQLHLRPGSLLKDAGFGEGRDPDGSPADIGMYGGLQAHFSYYEDVDLDGLYDGWEIQHGLKPWRRDAHLDADLDGLNNYDELTWGLDPNHGDTDLDGLSDAEELQNASAPANPFSPNPTITLPTHMDALDLALLRAPEGAHIFLEEGRWQGRFSPLGKRLTIEGIGPWGSILDGGNLGPVFRCVKGETRDTRLIGVTLEGGVNDEGAGLTMIDSGCSLNDVVIQNNQAELGGGAYFKNSLAHLTNVRFHNNKASSGGGALFVSGGELDLESMTISHNRAHAGGGIYFSEDGKHSLKNLEFNDNQADGDGGGMLILGDTTIEAHTLLFTENESSEGGGIYIADGSLSLSQSTFAANRAELGGALAYFGAPQVDINTSIFAYTNSGGAIIYDPRIDGLFTTQDLLFWRNTGGHMLDGDQTALALSPSAVEGDPYFWAEPCADTWEQSGLQIGPLSAAYPGNGQNPPDAEQWGAHGGPNASHASFEDNDEDGLPDAWEKLWDLDPSEVDPFDDLDGDGLSNLFEYNNGLNPTSRDTDKDGLYDQDEFTLGMDPRAPVPDISGRGPRL